MILDLAWLSSLIITFWLSYSNVTIIVLHLDLSFSKLYDAKDIEKKAIQYEFIIVREIRKVWSAHLSNYATMHFMCSFLAVQCHFNVLFIFQNDIELLHNYGYTLSIFSKYTFTYCVLTVIFLGLEINFSSHCSFILLLLLSLRIIIVG